MVSVDIVCWHPANESASFCEAWISINALLFANGCFSSYVMMICCNKKYLLFLPREQLCQRCLGSRNSVRPSVRLSVRHTRALWQNQTTHCSYFDTTRKGDYSAFWQGQWLVGDVPFGLKFALKVTTPPFETRRLRQISAYNVSTIRNRAKCSIMTNGKSTTGFPTRYRWSVYVTPSPKSPKGCSKSDFSLFE